MSALSVIRDRWTISRYGPAGPQSFVHLRQPASVSFSAGSASTGAGAGKCEGHQVSTNGTRSPSPTVKSATVLRSAPRVLTGVCSRRQSGPATELMPPSMRCTHGTTEPYPKRMISSIRMGTRPRFPTTMRSTSVPSPRMGIMSRTVALPSPVSNSVSRMSVPSR